MLDQKQDGGHEINATEFVDGCMSLKGPFKAIEGAMFKQRIDQKLSCLAERLTEIQAQQLKSSTALSYILERVAAKPDPGPRLMASV